MHYHTTSETFSYRPVSTRNKDEKEVLVFVIGETSRAGNWELFGYNRPTTPRLIRRSDIIPFGRAITEINTTHKAVPMLLSYLTPDIFGDSVAYTKSIFSAFNDLGYNTAFLSNQRRNHSYIDFYGGEAQKCKFLTDNGGPQEDMNLVEAMKNILENSSNNKLFIVLHTYGSHFEYKNRYPETMAHFTPDNNSAASVMNRRDLINAYDNTIRYTDAVLDSVITTLDRLNVSSAMVYVSDHGEDIFDDRRERFLHSSPTPTFYQIHVPMLIWMSENFRNNHPEMYSSALKNSSKNISSTRSIFHTLMEMAGIRSSYLDYSYSAVSYKFTETPRRYLNDYNESVPLSESGLRDLDFEAFNKNGISFK
ncbi:MAG: phosphoethanolamine transferase [Muribaculaceae bacterium]|nr:phosphoethanolamine transferase [Muribaculaceae bacterium]